MPFTVTVPASPMVWVVSPSVTVVRVSCSNEESSPDRSSIVVEVLESSIVVEVRGSSIVVEVRELSSVVTEVVDDPAVVTEVVEEPLVTEVLDESSMVAGVETLAFVWLWALASRAAAAVDAPRVAWTSADPSALAKATPEIPSTMAVAPAAIRVLSMWSLLS
jgi:hypothetical protein